MSQPIHIASLSELPIGEGREFVVEGRLIAVFRIGDEVYALDGVCPHAGGPLGQGELNGTVVTCPWHGWQFDVTNGRHGLNPNLTHSCIPLHVEKGEVYVRWPD